MQEKAKQVYQTENELKAHIKSGCFAPCYLIFGEEHFLIKSYVDKMVSKAVDSYKEFNINRFDGKVSVQEIYDAVEAFPMMCPTRVVLLCDYPFDKVTSAESEKLLQLLSDMPSTTVLIMWYETVEINGKKPGEKFSSLIKAVNKANGAVLNIRRKSEGEIIKMLQTGAAKRRCKLDASTARYMIETCSDDLGTLVNELEKLCLYVGNDGVITNQIIDKVCSRSVEASVYNVSKAVLRGDIPAACRLLDDLFYMNTDPAYIINLLSSAFVDIYRAFAARSAGQRPEEIAKTFGYGAAAFRLTEADRQLKKYTELKLTECLKLLCECERMIKGSRCDGRALLEKVIVDLTVVVNKDE